LKRLNWKIIKQIYISVLKYGHNIRIEKEELIMNHPNRNTHWITHSDTWYTSEKLFLWIRRRCVWHRDIIRVWTIYKDTWVAIK